MICIIHCFTYLELRIASYVCAWRRRYFGDIWVLKFEIRIYAELQLYSTSAHFGWILFGFSLDEW